MAKEILKTGRQIRHASIDALNHTAFQARKAAQKSLDKEFTLKNKWTEKGILVEQANAGKEYADVFSRDWYIAQHEKGTKRQPPKRNTFGDAEFEIPTENFFDFIQGVNRKTIIPKKFKPKSLLKIKVNGNRPFLVDSKHTQNKYKGIYVRTKAERHPIRLLYGLSDKEQRIQKKSWFYIPVQITFMKRTSKRIAV